jgi:hypothetical protein
MNHDPYPNWRDGADRLTDYLTENTGLTWTRHHPGARLDLGGLYIVAFDLSVMARAGEATVMLWNGPIADALPMLSDPAALRTRVREELARALATIDTEPTP